MKTKIQIILLIAFSLISGCSQEQSSEFNAIQAEKDVKEITFSLFQAVSINDNELIYNKLLHSDVQAKFPLDKVKSVSQKISSKLGSIKSLTSGNRADYDMYQGGWLARVTYKGNFENGDADVYITALWKNNQWKILNFNINSPLLFDDPTKYRKKIELYVTESDFVMPGTHVKIIDISNSTEHTLVEDATVLNVRWKVSGSDKKEGFISFALTQEEMAIINKSSKFSLRTL